MTTKITREALQVLIRQENCPFNSNKCKLRSFEKLCTVNRNHRCYKVPLSAGKILREKIANNPLFKEDGQIDEIENVSYEIYECPECGAGSNKIGQFRSPFGPMWCTNCKFRVEKKEIHNPFLKIAAVLKKNEPVKIVEKDKFEEMEDLLKEAMERIQDIKKEYNKFVKQKINE